MEVIKYRFQQHGDERGQLVALEEMRVFQFEIKRVYYMYDTRRWCTKRLSCTPVFRTDSDSDSWNL